MKKYKFDTSNVEQFDINQCIKHYLDGISSLDGTEVGEYIQAILFVAKFSDKMSDEFQVSLEKEINRIYIEFFTNYEIVEEEETYTHRFKELRRVVK